MIIDFKYNDALSSVFEFKRFTQLPLNHFNNDNIMTVIQNIYQSRCYPAGQMDKYKLILKEFLDYFLEHYLQIGNSCILCINRHSDCAKSVVFSNDDQYIVSASNDKTINVHKIPDGELIHTFRENTDKVLTLAYSKVRALMASGGRDTSVRLYDMNNFVQIQVNFIIEL